jgi:hypothetical protein
MKKIASNLKGVMYKGLALVLVAFPFVAGAQSGGFQNLDAAVNSIGNLITKLIPIVIGAAVLVFLWGILRFVVASDAEDRTAARNFMIFGVVALFVMVSVWGLVNFFRNTLGVNGSVNTPPPPPGVPGWR